MHTISHGEWCNDERSKIAGNLEQVDISNTLQMIKLSHRKNEARGKRSKF